MIFTRPPRFASAALALSLAACGGSDFESASSNPDGSSSGPGSGGAGSGGSGSGGGQGCPTCTGDHVWSRSFGGSADNSMGLQEGSATVDPFGNVLISCRFSESMSFGNISIFHEVAVGDTVADGCAAKLDPEGTPLWALAFGAADTNYMNGRSGAAPVADADGTIYISSNYRDSIDFGGETIFGVSGLDVALAQLSSDGQYMGAVDLGSGAGDEYNLGLALTDKGLITTGFFEGTLAGYESNSYDAYAAHLSWPATTWMKQFGGEGYQTAYSVAADPMGGFVFVGGFEGTIDFGGGPITSNGSFDGFIAKLDAEGNHEFSRGFGDMKGYYQTDVATDAAGGVVALIGTDQDVDLGGGALVGKGGWDVVVARYDAAGNHLWSKRFGDDGDQIAVAVAVSGDSVLIVGDIVTGAIDLGGGPLEGQDDFFVAKLDAHGEHVWSKKFGGDGLQMVTSIAADKEGNVIVAGKFESTIDLGGGPLSSSGGADMFVAKFAP